MFRRRRGEITVSVAEEEANLLRRFIDEYLELLGAGDETDPVMKRLFPDASLDDNKVRADYRELARDPLERQKISGAETARRSLGDTGGWEATLTEEERDAWMVLLTDLRLVIGTRLDVTEEVMSTEPDPADPEQWPLAVIHYLGWLQQTLVDASQ